jgi:hypothetical protein
MAEWLVLYHVLVSKPVWQEVTGATASIIQSVFNCLWCIAGVCRLEPGEEACQRAWGRLALCQFLAIFGNFLHCWLGWRKKSSVFWLIFLISLHFWCFFGLSVFFKWPEWGLCCHLSQSGRTEGLNIWEKWARFKASPSSLICPICSPMLT